jgi:Cu-Zn family superoxide dismutase
VRRELYLVAVCLLLAGFLGPSGRSQGMSHSGVAILKPTAGNNVKGTIRFLEVPPNVHIIADVTGLTPGQHGFHVHEKGDCSAPDASSAGGHFNPEHKMHGGPEAAEHHMGDLGNLVAGANGRAHYDQTVSYLELAVDPNTIDGKAVIVHAGPDDLHSQPAGNSGARVACGIIRKKN